MAIIVPYSFHSHFCVSLSSLYLDDRIFINVSLRGGLVKVRAEYYAYLCDLEITKNIWY